MNGQAAPSIETTRSPTPVFSDSPPSAYEDGTPPPAAKPKARPPRGTSGVKCCVMCKRPEPKATLFHCIDCGIIAHQQCYGMDSAVDGKEWRCDSCSATAEQPDKVALALLSEWIYADLAASLGFGVSTMSCSCWPEHTADCHQCAQASWGKVSFIIACR